MKRRSALYETYQQDGNTYARRIDGMSVCDFCLKANPGWTFPASPMPIAGHPVMSGTDDDWAACDECRNLIEAENIGGMVERMVVFQPIHEPPSDEIYYPPLPLQRRRCRENIVRFLQHRTGPSYRGSPQ